MSCCSVACFVRGPSVHLVKKNGHERRGDFGLSGKCVLFASAVAVALGRASAHCVSGDRAALHGLTGTFSNGSEPWYFDM